ncbi:MAG: hypothetical protein ACLFO2_01405 [Candidatus Woesearchaeota archaeon]
MSLFIHDISFSGDDLRLKITDGHDRRYELTTNWTHRYPAPGLDKQEELELEEALAATDAEFNTSHVKDVKQYHIEKKDYKERQELLTPSTKRKIQEQYAKQARWELKRYRLVSTDDTLTNILEKQAALNEKIRELERKKTTTDGRQEEEQAVKKLYQEGDRQGLRQVFTQWYEEEKGLLKPRREALKEQLERHLDAEPKTPWERREHERLITGTFLKAHDEKQAHQARLDTRKALRKPETEEEQTIAEAKQDLEALVKQHGGEIKDAGEGYHAHLPLMSRQEGKPQFKGVTLKEKDGKPERIGIDELLDTNTAYYDIEKPQYDTWAESITWCGTTISTRKGQERILDTVRTLTKKDIEGFKVRRSEHEHELVKNVAETVAKAHRHVIYNASYEGKQFREEGSFTITGKQPRKKAIPQGTAGSAKDFMTRWELSPWSETIDLMTAAKIAMPHLPNHQLETVSAHLHAQAGSDEPYTKSISYEEMRHEDRKEESEELARYTVEDAEELHQADRLEPTRKLHEDILDASHTFGPSISQAMKNANTTRELWEETFFEKYGRHLDQNYFREQHRKEIQDFKKDYTRRKKKSFEEAGLDVSNERKLHTGVDQYYFSPELALARHLPLTEEFYEYVNKTERLHDPQRRLTRLQYLRSFMIPMLADYTTLREKKKELEEEVAEKAEKARGNQDQEKVRGLFKNIITHKENAGEKAYPDIFKENIRQVLAKVAEGETDTTGTKTLLQKLATWRNKHGFFEKLYRMTPGQVEHTLLKTFDNATRLLNESTATTVGLEGKFLYVKGSIDEDKALDHGLVKVQEGIDVLATRTHVTYRMHGDYHKHDSDRGKGTARKSHYHILTERAVLKKLFANDQRGALETAAYAAKRLRELGQPKDDARDENLRRSLLKHNRSKGTYTGVQDGEEKEYTEEDKHAFEPDAEHYQETYLEELYGLTTKYGKPAVETKAPIAKLIDTIAPLDQAGKANHYRTLITSDDEHERERSLEALLTPPEKATQGTLF